MIELSRQEIDDFAASKVWQRIVELAREGIEVIHHENDDIETNFSKVVYNRGAVAILSYLMMLPEKLKEEIDANTDANTDKPEEGRKRVAIQL